MALRRTLHLQKHVITQGSNHHFGWERYPTKLYNGALAIPAHPTIVSDEKMRGSGIWGPEKADILKLALYNRLRQRKFQREVPSLAEQQEHNKMEVAIVWWCFGVLCFMGPLNWWAKKYRMIHEHYPWMVARTDGTRGSGAYVWFIE
eukprot:GEMP01057294.1.p1 GENE.GEMP01057294.1~~GEMP01057294.1.p1  ORF type:complete len:154 (+),score=26.55 GEMP01057294.1:22-462(+)